MNCCSLERARSLSGKSPVLPMLAFLTYTFAPPAALLDVAHRGDHVGERRRGRGAAVRAGDRRVVHLDLLADGDGASGHDVDAPALLVHLVVRPQYPGGVVRGLDDLCCLRESCEPPGRDATLDAVR